ncbi:ABC transporter permease [Luteimonas deserti]|uniref:ABC transporter permease n=1 Tax=Luteimonas deserti TaxID=2752306 RepID=A0A7Z0QRS7_9GAMM|nr:ABC transporter permease [Luteimonas deserti]NYZ61840.1 ABC transporter permease [Luteimonas deserti]
MSATMRWMWSVARKELLDIGRDRRTLFMALLLGPLMYPLLMLGMQYMAEKRMKTELDRVLEVPVIGAEHAPNLVAHLETLGIRAVDPPADLDAAIGAQQVDVAIEIPATFAEDWHAGRPATVEIISDSTRRNAQTPASRVRAAVAGYGQQVGALRLLARGVDPAVVQPVAVGTRDVATEEAKRGVILSVLLPYLLILSSFIGGSYLILDATAGERERQSLEPLLATPAARGAIVSGKIAAACVIGITSLLLTMLAFKISAQMGTGAARMLDVSFPAIGRMLLVLLPMLFIGTSLLTFLAATAKSMKEAQSHIVWLMLLPMVPSFVLMVNPIKTELWQFAVPFLAQNQLLLKVIRAEAIPLQVWALYLGASLSLAALLWFAAVKRYQQERLAVAG